MEVRDVFKAESIAFMTTACNTFSFAKNRVPQSLSSPSVYSKVHKSLIFCLTQDGESVHGSGSFSLNLTLKNIKLFLHEMLYAWRILKKTRQARKQLSENFALRKDNKSRTFWIIKAKFLLLKSF